MSTHRTRTRRASRAETARARHVDERQAEVDANAAELAVLWQVMPAALARDSSGMLREDRQSKGGSAGRGSAATVNVNVLDAAARIETGLYRLDDLVAEQLQLTGHRSAPSIITALPTWHATLGGRGLGKQLAVSLDGWLYDLRGALGLRRYDVKIGVDCPEHERPVPLLKVGDHAVLDPTIVASPPPIRRPQVGPYCADDDATCRHRSCFVHRAWPRLVGPDDQLTDWVWVEAQQRPHWSAVDGRLPWKWETGHAIRCPHCKATWTTTSERRVLARRLADAGAAPRDAAALIS